MEGWLYGIAFFLALVTALVFVLYSSKGSGFYNAKMAIWFGVLLWLASLITFIFTAIDYEIGGLVWFLFLSCILILLFDIYFLVQIIRDIYKRKETNNVNGMKSEVNTRQYRFNVL